VATAYALYRGILDGIVAADYDVLGRRVSVGALRRLTVALPALVRSLVARAAAARLRGPASQNVA
jgi:phytoene synthase